MRFYRVLLLLIFFYGAYLNAQTSKDPVKANREKRAYVKKEEAKREDKVQKVIASARKYKGVPYDENGSSKKGMDGVNFIRKAFKKAKITLPESLEEQSNTGERIYIGELQPGDLVFYALSEGSDKLFSAGIVVKIEHGDVYFIQCTSINGVAEYKLNDPKWKGRYVMARRIIPEID